MDSDKFIKIIGAILVIMGWICILIHFLLLGDPNYTKFFRTFVIFVTFFHLALGTCVLMKSIWGFYILKAYLYVLYIAFPIGTVIAHKSLRYIDKNNVKNSFKNQE
jgi:hypothetical protein